MSQRLIKKIKLLASMQDGAMADERINKIGDHKPNPIAISITFKYPTIQSDASCVCCVICSRLVTDDKPITP